MTAHTDMPSLLAIRLCGPASPRLELTQTVPQNPTGPSEFVQVHRKSNAAASRHLPKSDCMRTGLTLNGLDVALCLDGQGRGSGQCGRTLDHDGEEARGPVRVPKFVKLSGGLGAEEIGWWARKKELSEPEVIVGNTSRRLRWQPTRAPAWTRQFGTAKEVQGLGHSDPCIRKTGPNTRMTGPGSLSRSICGYPGHMTAVSQI